MYRFVGDPITYDWDELPVYGSSYPYSYKFGDFINDIEDIYTEALVKGWDFLLDWEIWYDAISEEGKVSERLDKIEKKMREQEKLVDEIFKKLGLE